MYLGRPVQAYRRRDPDGPTRQVGETFDSFEQCAGDSISGLRAMYEQRLVRCSIARRPDDGHARGAFRSRFRRPRPEPVRDILVRNTAAASSSLIRLESHRAASFPPRRRRRWPTPQEATSIAQHVPPAPRGASSCLRRCERRASWSSVVCSALSCIHLARGRAPSAHSQPGDAVDLVPRCAADLRTRSLRTQSRAE